MTSSESEIGTALFVGFIVGAVLAIAVTFLMVQNDWQKLSVGHGAAHYTAEGKFEWNGGK